MIDKKEKNLLITDSSREQQILDKAEQFATENEIKNIYGNIFKEAKNLQAKYLVLGNASYTYSSYIHQRFTNENYQIQETDDLKQERYYTRQMLKVDSFLAKDFAFLSAKIHKDYEGKYSASWNSPFENISDDDNYEDVIWSGTWF